MISLDCFPYEIPGKEHFGSSVSDEMPRQGLAEIVSQEKSESIDQLHYKIAELGPVRIKRMVLEIFDQLLGGKCRAKEIACKYGLDKVTFSRFAGTKWSNSDTVNPSRVPVLWKNTAGILASDDRFVQAAKNSGLWDKIRAICGDRFPRREDK